MADQQKLRREEKVMNTVNTRFHKTVVYSIVGIMMIPILATFIYSISSRWGATILPDGFTLDWYINLLTDPRFLQAFGRSLFICVAALSLSVVLVLPAIFVVFYYFPKLDKVMNILILLPVRSAASGVFGRLASAVCR